MNIGIDEKIKAGWEHRVPSLDQEWTLWWIDGDGGIIGVTDNLLELKRVVEENYGKNLRIEVFRAKHNSEGDLVAQKGSVN